MPFRNRLLCSLTALAGLGCSTATGPAIDAIQIDDVWVFAYAQTPSSSMDALGGGTATVVDGCLQMGDAVVVWRPAHLSEIEEVVAAIEAGDTVVLEVGGGGLSLDEGSSLDDFPAAVLEHCTPRELWFSADLLRAEVN